MIKYYYYNGDCMATGNKEEAIQCYLKDFSSKTCIDLTKENGAEGIPLENPENFVNEDTIQYIDSFGVTYDGWYFVYTAED